MTLVLTATLTLAVAIGANTAVFSIVDSILIRPLVYPNSERLYWIAEHTRDRSGSFRHVFYVPIKGSAISIHANIDRLPEEASLCAGCRLR